MAKAWKFRLDFTDVEGGEDELFDAISAKLAYYWPQVQVGERVVLTIKADKKKV